MDITHKIRIDLSIGGRHEVIYAVQGDKNSRVVKITLLDSGQAFVVPEGASGIVRYRRADGTGGNYDTTPAETAAVGFSGNVATVQIAPDVLAVPGIAQVAVAIVSDTAIIHTFVFQIDVQKNPSYNVTTDGGFYLSGALPDSGWEPYKYLGTDGNGKVIAKDAPSGGGGVGQMVVTYDDEVEPWQASHTAAEIISHIENGGGVILKQGTDDLISYAHLYGEFYGSVMFFDVNTTDNSTEMSIYTVHSTGEVTAEVFTMNGGTAQEEKGVKSYTVTRAGQTITMVLTLDDDTKETHVLALDENDYPTSITVNGKTITGEWSGF